MTSLASLPWQFAGVTLHSLFSGQQTNQVLITEKKEQMCLHVHFKDMTLIS